MTSAPAETHFHPATRTARTIAVVSNHSDPDVLDVVVGAGGCDVILIESLDRAYSRIKHVRPDLVIVCLDADTMEGFHVLTMLSLDRSTSHIPVLTYLAAPESLVRRDDPLTASELSIN